MSQYDLILYTPRGQYLDRLRNVTNFDMVRTENQVGTLAFDLPIREFGPTFFSRDMLCDVMRNVDGRWYLLGETHYLLRKKALKRDIVSLTFHDGIDLLDRRVVAYEPDDPQCTYDAVFADDAMKAIVDENMGVLAVDTERDLSVWLDIAPDYSDGPVISKDFSGRRVLGVLQDISKAAVDAGTYTGFDVISSGNGRYIFKTYTEQRGVNRTREVAGQRPVTFSEELGNLTDSVLTYDYTQERTFIYARSAENDGVVVAKTAFDAKRIGASPFNRIEDWQQVESETDASVQCDADMFLMEGMPKVLVEGKGVEVAQCRFGIDYNFGDLVLAKVHGITLTCRVRTFHVSFPNGHESIEIMLSNTDIPT